MHGSHLDCYGLQEGDSWAICFADAQDAVAFCLQAQQALNKVSEGSTHQQGKARHAPFQGRHHSPGVLRKYGALRPDSLHAAFMCTPTCCACDLTTLT